MSGTQTVPTQRLDAILEESIRLQFPLVLTHRTPQGWRTYKAMFASGSSESDSIIVRARIAPQPERSTRLKPGETIGVTFRLGHKKCMFGSVLQTFEQQSEDALISLCWPDQLQQLRRRAYKRVAPPRGRVVAVRFWHEDKQPGSTPPTRTVRHGQLENISAGGMRIKTADPKDMRIGWTYRCVFSPRAGAAALILEATLRHHEAGDQQRVSLGFQLVGLETSAEGRRTLDRLAHLVSDFQRASHRP